MILGFAHIIRNVRYGRPLSVLSTLPVPSAPEKWPMMVNRATVHRLDFQKGEGVLIELVEYDTELVEQRGRLRVGVANVILIDAVDRGAEIAFICSGLGLSDLRFYVPGGEVRDLLELRCAIPSWNVDIGIIPDAHSAIDPPLDIAGYAALAFYSSDVEADRDHLLKHGGRTPTEPFTVELDRKMKIVMLRSPEGTIIELIQVLT